MHVPGSDLSQSHCPSSQVIPPKEWKPCKSYDSIGDFRIETPISQFVTGQQGVYQLYNIQKKCLTFAEFSEMANSDRYDRSGDSGAVTLLCFSPQIQTTQGEGFRGA